MDESQVQEVFARFSASLPYTAKDAERAEFLAHYLWLGLIGGRLIEDGIWKTLQEGSGMAAEDVKAIRQCYSDDMRSVVTSDELKALRKRYGIDPKHPSADFGAAKERIFQNVHLPVRKSRRRARVLIKFGIWGGLDGAAVGSLLASVEASRRGAIIGGASLLIFGLVAGAAYGKVFGAVDAMRVLVGTPRRDSLTLIDTSSSIISRRAEKLRWESHFSRTRWKSVRRSL